MRQARAGVAAMVASGAALWGGCAAPPIVASAGLGVAQLGAETFIDGELRSVHVAEYEVVVAATEKTLADLEFERIKPRIGDRVATITAMEQTGRRIRFEIQQRTPAVTSIRIQVGMFGDRTMSRLLLGTIQSRLPALPAMPLEEEF